MPSIGTRHRSDNNFLITTEIYGPTLTFMFDPKDVLKTVKRLVEEAIAPVDPKKLAILIADCVADLVDHDPNAKWLECEVLTAEGIFYNDVVVLQE